MNPSSTHSSPRSFHSDLSSNYPQAYPHYPHHSQTYPIPNYPSRPAHKSTLPLPIALSVSTSTAASDHDPNEKTARPSNAHKHAQFLSGALMPSHTESESSRSLLFDDLSSSDDPGATPVVTHPPSTTSAAGIPTPLHSAGLSGGSSSNDASTSDEFSLSNTPGLSRGLSRPLAAAEQEKLAHLDRLKFFLATAPSQWDNARPTQSFVPTTGSNAYPSASIGAPSTVGSSTGWGMGLPTGNGAGTGAGADAYTQGMHPSLNRFMLPSQEFVTCVLWNGLYHITGTDIVRALVYRFEAFGRPVRNMKKFEEGVFSDLRNLKPGVDACLEEPKSPFLDLLFKYQCIRTQKKQKVFYWFSVPHDRLFLDALERDLKREKMGLEPTTHVVGEPALSFTYDPKRSLYEQFAKAQGIKEGETELESSLRKVEGEIGVTGSESDAELLDGTNGMGNLHIDTEDSEMSDADDLNGLSEEDREKRKRMKQEQQRKRHLAKAGTGGIFTGLFGIGGSPMYKQRRKKNPATSTLSRSVSSSSSASFRRGSEDFDERGRPRSMGSYGSGLAERNHHQSTSVSRERSYPYPYPYAHIQRQGQVPFQYNSMADEFGPGSLDARERAELDAATLFHRQARGELMPADGVVRKPKVPHVLPEVGVMISEGYTAHQVQSSGGQPQQQQPFPGQQQQPDVQAHHHLEGGYANGFDPTNPTGMFPPQSQQSNDPNNPQNPGTAPYETVSSDGKFRAYMCPLYSCGRLFKRMEHLKRHLRTHTMEKPYSCPNCQKRFSRSDNLNQHLRTHDRTGSALSNATGGPSTGASMNANFGAGSMDGMGIGMDMGGAGVTGMGEYNMQPMWREQTEDSDLSGTESEGFEDDYYHHHHQQSQLMSDPNMFGMSMLGGSNGPGGGALGLGIGGAPGEGFNMQMCEVEVQARDVAEVPGGEEEGLLLRNHPHGSMAQFASVPGSMSSSQQDEGAVFASNNSDFDPSPARWAQPQPSPAFSTISVPSPPPGASHMNRSQRSSMGPSPPGVMRPTHSASSSTSSISHYTGLGTNGATNTDDFVTSMSAPSHKQAFDHSNLYPAGILESTSLGGTNSTTGMDQNTPANAAAGLAGPIRRHRSMTPSLIGRTGESIRRPMSTASNASGGGHGNGEGSGSASPAHSVSGAMNGMGGGAGMGMGARGYHPYAGGYAGSSRPGSAHSSPAVHNIPLGSDPSVQQQQQHGLRRPQSRTSFVGLQDQMEMFRSESPGNFLAQPPHAQIQHVQQMHQSQSESPAPYTMELPPHQHGMYGHANTMPVGVFDQQNTHQQVAEGGYYPQPHTTL